MESNKRTSWGRDKEMISLINKILTKNLRLKIIKLLSNDLSLLINADVVGMVTPKTKDFYFNSRIEAARVNSGAHIHQSIHQCGTGD